MELGRFITAFTSARHLPLSRAARSSPYSHILKIYLGCKCEHAPYRLLAIHVPNLMSLFRCLGYTKVSVQVRGLLCDCLATQCVFTVAGC